MFGSLSLNLVVEETCLVGGRVQGEVGDGVGGEEGSDGEGGEVSCSLINAEDVLVVEAHGKEEEGAGGVVNSFVFGDVGHEAGVGAVELVGALIHILIYCY